MNNNKTSTTIPVSGLTCASCVSHVRQALEQQPGVTSAHVDLVFREARVEFDPQVIEIDTLLRAIRDRGYGAEMPLPPEPDLAREEQAAREAAQAEEYQDLRRKAVISGLLGILSMALMHQNGARHFLLAITTLVMAWAGRHFYTRAWSAFRHRVADMNTLIATGTLAAYLYSVAATFAPGFFVQHGIAPAVYYEAVTLIIALILTGNALETRARGRTSEALKEMLQLQPPQARILASNGTERTIPAEHVQPGDFVLIRPGEKVPVDGIVVEGASAVDESLFTGEPNPVTKQTGDKLIGGTINRFGALRYRATASGAAGTLARIIRLMREAQASRAPMQKLADRVSAVFVPIVISIAIATFTAWLLLAPQAGLVSALSAAVAVLIIACPCAVGLAVPTAITVAIGRGAQSGILFKGGEALEKLHRIDTVLIDKTGTITEGRPSVTGVVASSGFSREFILQVAASVERMSEHPLAEAIVAAAEEQDLISAESATDFKAIPGLGASAVVGKHRVHIGNQELFESNGIALDPLLLKQAEQFAERGATPVFIAVDATHAGLIAVSDAVKPSSLTAIRKLRSKGLRVVMLTGDRQTTALAVARQVGIEEVVAGVLPDGKVDEVKRQQQGRRRVAMIGDGVNDAPALAQADAGIAMAAGSGIASEAADVTLMRNDLEAAVAALDLAGSTYRIMQQNLVWAFLYNVIGIPLAAGLLLTPVFASVAMALSSVSVISNSLRLRK